MIEHPDALATLPDGVTRRQMVFSRYGHVNDQIPVKVNDQVTRGQLVGSIGLARNVTSGWHLHFDIAFNPNFRNWPSHWPDMRRIRELQAQGKTSGSDYSSAQMEIKKQALAYYIDPFKFLRDNHG